MKQNVDHHGYIEWIEKLDSETYPLNNEERWKTEENLHRFAYGNISEALRKHLDLDFLHGNNFFHPKQLKYITRGIQDP